MVAAAPASASVHGHNGHGHAREKVLPDSAAAAQAALPASEHGPQRQGMLPAGEHGAQHHVGLLPFASLQMAPHSNATMQTDPETREQASQVGMVHVWLTLSPLLCKREKGDVG